MSKLTVEQKDLLRAIVEDRIGKIDNVLADAATNPESILRQDRRLAFSFESQLDQLQNILKVVEEL